MLSIIDLCLHAKQHPITQAKCGRAMEIVKHGGYNLRFYTPQSPLGATAG